VPAPPQPNTAAPRDEFANALRECLPLFWTAVLFAGGVNVLFLASPIYLLQIYNRVVPSGSVPTLIALSVAALIAFITMVILDAVRARVLIRAAARLDRLLSERLFNAVVELGRRTGPSVKNAQPLRDLDTFRQAMAGPAAHLFFDAPWSPLFLIVLYLLHPILGVIGTVGALILLALAWLNDAFTREDASQSGEAAQRSYAFAESVVRYADPVQAMGMTEALNRRWRVDRDDMIVKQSGGSDRAADFSAVIRFARLVLQSAVIGVGALLVIRGAMLPASIFAASLLLGRALSPLEQAVIGWRQMASAITAGRNVQKALSSAPPRDEPPTRVPIEDSSVSIENVGFLPRGARAPALRGVSLRIASGEAVGVVGASGAGKSCLARIIVGASLPSQGRVTVGGLPTTQWLPESLARHVGYLPQNVGLFPGTIRQNIARFRDVADHSVLEAARRANVHDMILDLPEGYDTRIGEGGSGLSGGQRQRVALARALFGRPRLLVLDEPNAHLDGAGEEALAEALRTLKASGTTVVIVAHRLNPLAEVDRVLMLKNGQLELDGPREEVIEQVPVTTVEQFGLPLEPAPA